MKAVLATIMVISVLAPALVLLLPVFAANENVAVSITSDPSISAALLGDTATVPIIVHYVTDLGAGTLTVAYNSSICTVTDVTEEDILIWSKNISVPGIVRISALDMSGGHTGDVTFANLEIRAIGTPEETSPLNITAETLTTYGPPPGTIPPANISVSNGTFTVLTPTPFDTGRGTYPSISGTHNGTITPNQTITVQKLYTYPCAGTGGHSEHVRIWNKSGTTITEGNWTGYGCDWHNITFNVSFVLYEDETYNYTIRTGSYPQIIHAQNHTTTLEEGSLITCKEFIDANGKKYTDWIPAIRLWAG